MTIIKNVNENKTITFYKAKYLTSLMQDIRGHLRWSQYRWSTVAMVHTNLAVMVPC